MEPSLRMNHVTAVVTAIAVSILYASTSLAAGDPAATSNLKPVPRTADGHPDLTGTWDNGGGLPPLKNTVAPNGSVCIDCGGGLAQAISSGSMPKPDRPVYKPEFEAKVKDLAARQTREDTSLHCRNPGLPRIGAPDKIIQTAGQLVFLYDDFTGMSWRIIPTDGRPHRDDVSESYLGDSVGHWEGDVMVIDATNFNDETWLGDNGLFHTSELRVTERLHRVGDTIEYQAIVTDPKVLAQPWVMRPRVLKLTDQELEETPPCFDKDMSKMINKSYHPNFR